MISYLVIELLNALSSVILETIRALSVAMSSGSHFSLFQAFRARFGISKATELLPSLPSSWYFETKLIRDSRTLRIPLQIVSKLFSWSRVRSRWGKTTSTSPSTILKLRSLKYRIQQRVWLCRKATYSSDKARNCSGASIKRERACATKRATAMKSPIL